MADYSIRRATLRDLPAVLALIDDAARWLKGKGTDQWAKPWPNRSARDERVRRGVEEGKTWIVFPAAPKADGEGDPQGPAGGDADPEQKPIATITLDQTGNPRLWAPECLREPAGYVQRLVISRSFEHRGLGARLMDWAGRRAQREWGAAYLRIDVWTSNDALHQYYKLTGFEHVNTLDDPGYPAGVLMQKRTEAIPQGPLPFVVEEADEPGHKTEPAHFTVHAPPWHNPARSGRPPGTPESVTESAELGTPSIPRR